MGKEKPQGMCLTRRRFFHWLLAAGSGGTLVAMLSAASSLKPLVIRQEAKLIAEGDRLRFAVGPWKGGPITRDSLELGESALALPQGKEDVEDNIVVVVRLTPEELTSPTVPEWTTEGYVAYSAICTHLGCTVLNELRSEAIYCPCHAGVYDPRRGAIVISGPPPRPLPQLPIRFNREGELEVAGGFEGRVGVL